MECVYATRIILKFFFLYILFEKRPSHVCISTEDFHTLLFSHLKKCFELVDSTQMKSILICSIYSWVFMLFDVKSIRSVCHFHSH